MITLINPPGIKSFSGLQMHTPNPPLGLAYIAGTLKAAGLPFRVIDATGEALDAVSPYPDRGDFMVQGLTIDEVVRRLHPDTRVVGVTCTFSTLWPITNRVARAVREKFPNVLMVLGGEHGTAVPENVLAVSPFDVVVLGEGEETFVELLRAHAEGRPLSGVKGLAVRDNGRVVKTGLSARRRDVDAIPPPDWESFPIREYIDRHQINGVNLGRSMPILGTRGCPFQCTFCSNPGMWTQRWIARDPKQLVDEMERYLRTYGTTNFDFQDLTAIVKRQWVVDFCRELITRDLGITWQMPIGTRAEVFDADVADLLYRSGCRALAFAPESGSPEILKIVKKQVDLDHMKDAVRAAVRRGLTLSCFIVIGFPDDTRATLRQSLWLVRKLAVLGVHDIAVSKFVPYPGSELFRRLQREGKIQLDDDFFVSPMDFYTAKAPSYADAVSTRRLYWTMLWMFVNFYVLSFSLRPWRVVRALVRAVATGTEETRYAKWFMDMFFTRRRWRRLAGGAAS
jgi:radical SAM superfamily enzyme YgiQ (UPF0313 family)